MRPTHLQSLALLAGVTALPSAFAWGAAGHEIVATIAQVYTQPDVLEKICSILNAYTDTDHLTDEEGTGSSVRSGSCHLASISTWADKFKYRMRWSAPLHYVNAYGDHPADTCQFPGPDGWAGKPGINVLGGIHNTSSILLDYAQSEERAIADVGLAQEALKFLVHFLGDLHMPLHLVGRDRGGNGVDVCWEGRRRNFHSVWDGYIVAKAIRDTGYNYTGPLPGEYGRVERHLRGAIYDPYIRRIIWEGVEGRWATDLEGWLDCPVAGDGAEKEAVKKGVSAMLGNLLLPGWLANWGTAAAPVTDTDVICPYHWAQPIHALNCELIWPKDIDESFDGASPTRRPRCKRWSEEEHREVVDADEEPPYELDNSDYMAPIQERMLLEQFLAQAGVRLAGVLNYIFTSSP
jgi:hypothetical protein